MNGVSRIVGGLCREEILEAMSEGAPELSCEVERELYYPYHWFHLRYSARTLLGRTAVRVSCLVDARTGAGATSDAFERETVELPPEAALVAKLDAEEAFRVASRYGDYVVRSKRRALVAPEREVLESALVHKPFWIARCHDIGGDSYRVLVDGMNGGLHPLTNDRTA